MAYRARPGGLLRGEPVLMVEMMPAAVEDLEEILDYVRAQSPQGAERLGESILESIALLPFFPAKCPLASESSVWGCQVRTLIVFNHRVLYTVRTDRISVLRIVHGAMDRPVRYGRRHALEE